ncbi:uncharacterized protein LOC119579514 [Penaeus monodon]|uniref:uncharacterized protein LOC119579514 n=1 Tax=Penaeus monodon TaxID=6687 RepID=UPI0018A71ECE|nr:uncharacterized protein LOC119579514 [Penaeus monodon]
MIIHYEMNDVYQFNLALFVICQPSQHRLEEDRLLVRRVPRVSTCNQFATARGPGQKVVTYSYYGNASDHRVYDRYFSEIPRRAKEVAQRYPGEYVYRGIILVCM